LSRIFVSGLGAVSPAGWSVPALCNALRGGEPLPDRPLDRPGSIAPLRVRAVPEALPRPAFMAHARLRRASPITHYAASAALEALAGLRHASRLPRRIGLVVCVQAGCVNYSCRFFDETLKDPATASPLLFPETVHAAPASHVAALLENVTLACTLVGDTATFLQGVALGAQWLQRNSVEASLVLGIEETNWILADALRHLDRSLAISGGAGALCLSLHPAEGAAVELAAITDAHPYTATHDRSLAAKAMRAELPPCSAEQLLCDGLGGSHRADRAERMAWSDWTGPRLSPKRVLGEGLMACAAWQCVAACDAIGGGRCAAANVSLVGSNQEAIGARFVRAAGAISGLSGRDPECNIPA